MSEIEHQKEEVTMYTIFTMVVKKKGKNGQTDEVEHAVFSAQGVLDHYKTAFMRHYGLKDEDLYIRMHKTELKPEPQNFSLPLNPVFKPEDHEAPSEEVAEDNTEA